MIFLIFKHSLQVITHSMKQLVLFYQVYSNSYLYNELILLIYLHSLQVKNHSVKQLVLLYQVYSNWCLYNELIFLIYLHLLQVMNHSIIQLLLLYQVYSHSFSLINRCSFHERSVYTGYFYWIWLFSLLSCILLFILFWNNIWFKSLSYHSSHS